MSVIEWIEDDPRDKCLAPVMAECEERIRGCGRQEAEEALSHTVKVMNCRRPQDIVWAGYVSILMRYPTALLLPSMASAIARERYHVLPAAGALVAEAETELERQRAKVSELRRAIGKLALSRRRVALALARRQARARGP